MEATIRNHEAKCDEPEQSNILNHGEPCFESGVLLYACCKHV